MSKNPKDKRNPKGKYVYVVFDSANDDIAASYRNQGDALAAAKRWNKHHHGPADRYRIKVVSARRNPDTGAAMYEEFHGEPASTVTEYAETEEYPDDLAQLGVLAELKFKTPSGYDVTLTFDGDAPHLASTPDGRQMYFVGGDQAVDLDSIHMGGKWERPAMILGELYELTYRTAKEFHSFKLTDYFHKLGEETGDTPTLAYDATNGRLSIEGGKYQVKDVGICN
jgi:hypothetical protein